MPATDTDSRCSYVTSRPDGRCRFLDDRKMCTIYAWRPMDCRFFPFDIALIDGEYFWIVYDNYCQLKAGEWEQRVAQFESQYLPEILPFIHDIGLLTRDNAAGQPGEWRALRRVDFSVVPSAA